jgi:mannose-6-phosphate isomerase-like protein (cupin superfamily)
MTAPKIKTPSMTKIEIFNKISIYTNMIGIGVYSIDTERPWGGFFVINEKDSDKFIQHFFPEIDKNNFHGGAKLSPKILLVEPGKKLSWQYHNRRAEIWKLFEGKAAVVTSDTDRENAIVILNIGDVVKLKQGERHRLIGLADEWGVVAEIWMHTDPSNPSDENDIVRLQDDFGR